MALWMPTKIILACRCRKKDRPRLNNHLISSSPYFKSAYWMNFGYMSMIKRKLQNFSFSFYLMGCSTFKSFSFLIKAETLNISTNHVESCSIVFLPASSFMDFLV